jgi:hypothetical protein
MRNAVLALGALVLLVRLVSAQTAESEEPWANKLFKTKGSISHDFGVVPRGAQLKHTFKMKNIWKVPMQVTDIRVSCGCVTPTAEKRLLQPNEEANLDINMDARRFTGAKTVTVFVTLGPEFVSTAALRVSAVARQDVVFNPGTVAFGIVQRGQTPNHTLDVEYSGALDWRITEVVKNSSAPFKLSVEELYREKASRFRAGRVGYRFNVTLKGDAAAGPFKQEIVLKTNDPASPTLTAAIDGTIQAALAVEPANIRMDDLKVGDPEPKKMNVIVSGSRAFRILSVEGQGDGITVKVPGDAKANHILTIQCRPEKAGDLRKQLVIRTDLDGERVTVRVEAKVAQ